MLCTTCWSKQYTAWMVKPMSIHWYVVDAPVMMLISDSLTSACLKIPHCFLSTRFSSKVFWVQQCSQGNVSCQMLCFHQVSCTWSVAPHAVLKAPGWLNLFLCPVSSPLHPLIVVAIQDISVPSHWVLETWRLSLAYLEGGAAHGLTSLWSVLNAAMFWLCSFWFVPILCSSFYFAEFEWLDLSCRGLLNICIKIFLLCTKNCLDVFYATQNPLSSTETQ